MSSKEIRRSNFFFDCSLLCWVSNTCNQSATLNYYKFSILVSVNRDLIHKKHNESRLTSFSRRNSEYIVTNHVFHSKRPHGVRNLPRNLDRKIVRTRIEMKEAEITFSRANVKPTMRKFDHWHNHGGYSRRYVCTLPRIAWKVLSNQRFAPKCLEPPPWRT